MYTNFLKYFTPFILLISSCRFDVNQLDLPEWETSLLGPLGKSDLKLEEIAELKDLAYSTPVTISELGIPANASPTNVPAYNIGMVGPLNIIMYDQFEQVTAKQLTFKIKLTNNLPLVINEGAELEFKNQASGETIFTQTVETDIDSFSDYSASLTLDEKIVASNVEISLHNLSTQAASATQVTPTDNILIAFELSFNKIDQATLKANQQLTISDTANFSLEGDDLKSSALRGWFNTFVNNGFPFSGEMQAYFLTPENRVIDSLFQPDAIVTLPILNASGEVEQSTESKDSVAISDERMLPLLEAKKVCFKIKLHTANMQSSVAYNDSTIKAQIVGDLEISVNP